MEIINLFLALILGIWIASYTSSVFFRLPRGIPISGIGKEGLKPFCSNCKHPLKFYEYYSVLSWIFCGNKCNYCNQEISSIYRVSEAIVILSSVIIVYFTGFDEHYFLLLALAIELIISSSIMYSNFKLPINLMLIQGATQLILITYLNEDLLSWLLPVSISLYIPLFLQKMRFLKLEEEYNNILILNLITFSAFGYKILVFSITLTLILTLISLLIFKKEKKNIFNKIILNITNFIAIILATSIWN